jgi:hypothetical protein
MIIEIYDLKTRHIIRLAATDSYHKTHALQWPKRIICEGNNKVLLSLRSSYA